MRKWQVVLGLLLGFAACRADPPPGAQHLTVLEPIAATGLADGNASPPRLSVSLDDVTFEALAVPAPSTLEYELEVPEGGLLSFAIARGAGVKAVPGPIRFALRLHTGGESHLLFERSLPPRKTGRWFPETVDLSAWSGQSVRLALEAESDAAAPPKAALWGHPLLASRPSTRQERLVLLVSIDCLRADHVGAYGYARDTTPNIDRLARDGVVFENAIAAATSTFFTHNSMLTGLRPTLHGARRERRLSESVGFLPEQLAQAGWETEGFASWVYVSAAFGFDRGYHAYRVDPNSDGPTLVDAVLERLEHEVSARFVFLHLFEPHWPYRPARGFLERFGPRPADISELLDMVGGDQPPAGDEREQVMRLYDAEVAFTDAQLGRLFDALRERGLYDEALILVTADHGEAFFEHGHWEHMETLFEEIIRVPLIVKWPSSYGIVGGQRVADPVGQIDIHPTILEAAGIEAPASEARPLLRTLREGGSDRLIQSEAAWYRPDHTVLRVALRGRRYKYIAQLEGPPEPDFAVELRNEQLYDLLDDPLEQRDLISEPPLDLEPFRERLRSSLDEARAVASSRRGAAIEIDSEARGRLRELGYIE